MRHSLANGISCHRVARPHQIDAVGSERVPASVQVADGTLQLGSGSVVVQNLVYRDGAIIKSVADAQFDLRRPDTVDLLEHMNHVRGLIHHLAGDVDTVQLETIIPQRPTPHRCNNKRR